MIERIAILSPDSPEKIFSIIKESLKISEGENVFHEKSLSVPLKEARENFEKEYLSSQLKNLEEIYLKWLNLLEWKDQHYTEN